MLLSLAKFRLFGHIGISRETYSLRHIVLYKCGYCEYSAIFEKSLGSFWTKIQKLNGADNWANRASL